MCSIYLLRYNVFAYIFSVNIVETELKKKSLVIHKRVISIHHIRFHWKWINKWRYNLLTNNNNQRLFLTMFSQSRVCVYRIHDRQNTATLLLSSRMACSTCVAEAVSWPLSQRTQESSSNYNLVCMCLFASSFVIDISFPSPQPIVLDAAISCSIESLRVACNVRMRVQSSSTRNQYLLRHRHLW